MGRALARAGWVVAFLAMCLSLLAPPAHADGSSLSIDVSMDSSLHVSVDGRLTSGGKPVRQATVQGLIGDRLVAGATTRGNGSFHMGFDIPADLRTGQHRFVVRFHGRGSAEATETGVVLAISQPTQDAPRQPSAEPPAAAPAEQAPAQTQPSAAQGTRLAATADKPSPSNGDVVTISGTLLTAAGVAVSDAGIELHDAAGEITDAYVLTDAKGQFSTLFEVPIDQRDPVKLRVVFTGAPGYPVSEAAVELAVRFRDSATESPTPSPSPTAQASAEATTTVSANEPSEVVGGSTADRPRGLFDGAITQIVLIVLGLTVIVGASGAGIWWLAQRSDGALAGEAGAEVESLDFLDEDPLPDDYPHPDDGTGPSSPTPPPRRAAP